MLAGLRADLRRRIVCTVGYRSVGGGGGNGGLVIGGGRGREVTLRNGHLTLPELVNKICWHLRGKQKHKLASSLERNYPDFVRYHFSDN